MPDEAAVLARSGGREPVADIGDGVERLAVRREIDARQGAESRLVATKLEAAAELELAELRAPALPMQEPVDRLGGQLDRR